MPDINDEAKQVLASIFAGIIIHGATNIRHDNSETRRAIIKNSAEAACELADALDAEFKARGWDKQS